MKVGAQFYTLRDFTKTRAGFVEALDKVKAMGYEGVQLSAVACMDGDSPEVSGVDAAALLGERGLVCAATHRSWERLSGAFDEEVAFHKTLGCDYTALGMAPESYRSMGLDGYRQLVGEMKDLAAKYEAQGIRLGYHNHAVEFERMDVLERPYDEFLKATDVYLEVDTYWVHVGGVDVTSLVRKLKGRIPVVHVKDLTPRGWETEMAAVGEGNLDWDSILPTMKEAGTEWLLVEQDVCPRDPFDCLASSARFLKSALAEV